MFQVALSGNSIQTASGPKILLNDKQPLTKLDVTNNNSFPTIKLLFSSEPTQPTPTSLTTDTQLYQFKHNYTYVPATWMMWRNSSPAYPASPASGSSATTFYAFGDDTASANIPAVGSATSLSRLCVVAYNDPVNGVGNYSVAFLYVKVDKTNVTLYVRKASYLLTSSSTVVPIYLAGTIVDLRFYVFTEPATTSTY